MNEFRKLIESIEKIEEGYFKEQDIEHQEEALRWLKRNRTGEITPDEITRLGRESFQAGKAGEISKEAAKYVMQYIREEFETQEPLFPKEFGSQGRWAADYAKKHGKIAAYRGPGEFYVSDKDMPTRDSLGLEEESEITYLKHPEGYEPAPLPERHKLDSMDWMHVPDDVIQMMKSFEHKMKSQNVWDKGVELAGGEDQLWKVMQWRAEEVMEDYRGSGEGIGTSDMNHFVRGVFSDIGEDDIWGWDKKLASDEDMERDKANRGAKFGKAIRAEGIEEGEEDKNLGPYEDNYEQWQGQTIKITGGEHQGETGKVIDANWERNDTGSREGVYHVKLYSGPVVTLYLSEWSHDQIELAYDPTVRPDGRYDPELEEDIVKVPRELRGGDPTNAAGATSQEAEKFINSLGPDDSVSVDVVDPETGELLDWPDKGTRRALGQKQYKRDEKERKEREATDHEEGYDSPYLYVPGLDTDPEKAWEGIETLKYDREFTDFYNIVWRSVREFSGEPEDLGAETNDWADLDYDVDVDVPVAIKRADGKKFNKQDRQNFDMINKIFRAATGNIGVQYIGSSNEGSVARFIPSFM